MPAAFALLAAMLFAAAGNTETIASRQAPVYSPASILNSASNLPGPFAPNAIVSLYGTGLSFITRALQAGDIRNGLLPTVLTGSGVQVLINHLPAHIYFVSPNQVNLLLPSTLVPGPAELQLVLDGRGGPLIPLTLRAAAPALFLQAPSLAVSTRADGSLVSREAPGRPGDIIVLYAGGLGETFPALRYGELAREPAPLAKMDQLRVLLDGVPVPASYVLYAGVTVGFAGLYQINLRIPENIPADPEVSVQVDAESSPAGVRIPVRP